MNYCYIITNTINKSVYVGITNNPKERWSRHKSRARSTVLKKKCDTYLCRSIRKYGLDNFKFEVIQEFTNRDIAMLFEIVYIEKVKNSGLNCYNMTIGGDEGPVYIVGSDYYLEWKDKLLDGVKAFNNDSVRKEAHRIKLRNSRVGRKPALGMKHSASNKEYFKKVSNDYWDNNKVYTDDIVSDIIKLSLKEAKLKYGVSQTQFYRLRNKNNIKSLTPKEIGHKSWSNRYTYSDNATDIVKLSKKEAITKYGLSPTSYYAIKRNYKSK